MFRTSVFAPRLGTSLPTGATALEVQQDANHHSRYDVSQRKRRNVPQEVFHGVPPFREARPTRTQPTQSHYSRQEYRKGAEEVCEHSPGLGMVLVVPCP